MSLACGIDEAGRGPLAGPVYAAAVILNPKNKIFGLNDSKKLSHKKLLLLSDEIKSNALDYSYSSASVKEIDSLNILNASLLAMYRAFCGLRVKPDYVLVDGIYTPEIKGFKIDAIVRGDSLVAEISAASIIAKVERDRYMCELDLKYPQYNLRKHKGYPTKEHIELLKEHGVIDIYRKSFRPVKDLIQKIDT
ncbi:MAG: ribonuclease HII [Methylophilaceae bacterium]|nr:ribonuclease HII [Methylophilaceae bacterium]